MVDPLARQFDLLVPFLTDRLAKIVADRRAGDVQAQSKRLLFDLYQVRLRELFREVVRRQFSAVEILIGAELDEVFQSHLRCRELLGRAAIRQELVERVRRQAELHVALAISSGRLGGERRLVESQRGGTGGKAALTEKLTTRLGGLVHGGLRSWGGISAVVWRPTTYRQTLPLATDANHSHASRTGSARCSE